jgi:hypothetical protein
MRGVLPLLDHGVVLLEMAVDALHIKAFDFRILGVL